MVSSRSVAARTRVVEAGQTIQVAGASDAPRNLRLGICGGQGQRKIGKRSNFPLRPELADFGRGLHR